MARPEVLRALLASTDRIVQEIDSVEYGLTDIQEYYANTGAMKAAAETLRDGKKVRPREYTAVNVQASAAYRATCRTGLNGKFKGGRNRRQRALSRRMRVVFGLEDGRRPSYLA